jgi:hypothetical protein
MTRLHEPAIVRSAADLRILAREINKAHEDGENATRRGLEQFRAAGLRLLEAKKHVGHGGFKSWLEKNITFSYRTARRYMQLAREWPKMATMATLAGALAVLTRETEEQDESPEPVETPTPSTLPAPADDQPPDAGEPWDYLESDAAPQGQEAGGSEGEISSNDAGAPPRDGEGESAIPERLKPFFADVAKFEQAARFAERLANRFQEIEATAAYCKAVEGKKHREHSTFIRTAGRAIRAMTHRRPCPECGGRYEPSPDNDACKTCRDRGYLTAEEEQAHEHNAGNPGT